MSMTDPVADLLTRIRNALLAGKEKVDIPASSLKEDIARILQEEGYIKSYRVLSARIQRISTPGRRVYVSAKDVPRVLSGMGVAIMSTSKGVMTDADSRKQNVGGEVLCHVW